MPTPVPMIVGKEIPASGNDGSAVGSAGISSDGRVGSKVGAAVRVPPPPAMVLEVGVGVPPAAQVQSSSAEQLGFRQIPSKQKRLDLQLELEPQVPPQSFGSPGPSVGVGVGIVVGQIQSALSGQSGLRHTPDAPVMPPLGDRQIKPSSQVIWGLTDSLQLLLHPAGVGITPSEKVRSVHATHFSRVNGP